MSIKFTIACDFAGQKQPFDLYVGKPKDGSHPFSFQSNWLSKEKSGSVPGDVVEAVQKLYDLSVSSAADFEDLCYYALTTASQVNKGNNVQEQQVSQPQQDVQQQDTTGQQQPSEQVPQVEHQLQQQAAAVEEGTRSMQQQVEQLKEEQNVEVQKSVEKPEVVPQQVTGAKHVENHQQISNEQQYPAVNQVQQSSAATIEEAERNLQKPIQSQERTHLRPIQLVSKRTNSNVKY